MLMNSSATRYINRVVRTTSGGQLRRCLSASSRVQQHNKRLQSTAAVDTAVYDLSVETFPSILIGPDRTVVPQGPFAEAQAQYLDPDPDAIEKLAESLVKAEMGIVSHYYMDAELQGVLHAVQQSDPRLHGRVGTADSLKMGDMAVKMCREDNVQAIACLGVDFMAESVAAILEKNGFGHVPVYRATPTAIGCSLAESAERDSYRAWLKRGSQQQQNKNALHVVYINTSLETKAVSSSLVPTITCTSSNVVKTMLQASAQLGPDLKIMYGPDTYMGQNLVTFFDSILQQWSDERIQQELHPQHNRQSIRRLRDSIDVFPHGNCVVHHMFGAEVVETVRRQYDDCYVTAHLEVPGEMFEIGMEKAMEDKGVVGSTSDILNFINNKVEAASRNDTDDRLRFILGTEAGMVTSIVKSVQDILEKHGSNKEAEIIFPVASDAVMEVDGGGDDLSLVPGVSGGEGCSTAGGCATCPFMKMNDLDRLQDIVDMVADGGNELKLKAHLPPDRLRGKQINETNAIELGTESIMYMREFMKQQTLPEELLRKVRQGANTAAASSSLSSS